MFKNKSNTEKNVEQQHDEHFSITSSSSSSSNHSFG